MPQLDSDTFFSQLFWLVITFLFLYMILSRSLLPRIHSILENRKNKISHDIDRAEQLQAEAEEAKLHYEKALAESRAKAQSLIAESSALMEKSATARHAELSSKLEQKLAEAEANIISVKNAALAKLAPVSKELAQAIVEKLANQKLTAGDVNKVVDRLVKDKHHG